MRSQLRPCTELRVRHEQIPRTAIPINGSNEGRNQERGAGRGQGVGADAEGEVGGVPFCRRCVGGQLISDSSLGERRRGCARRGGAWFLRGVDGSSGALAGFHGTDGTCGRGFMATGGERNGEEGSGNGKGEAEEWKRLKDGNLTAWKRIA
jgi:hypothetical protein